MTDPSVLDADAPRELVVVLCLANRCRSPLAATMLDREVELLDVPVDVISAGFGEAGLPATVDTVHIGESLGFDLRTHVSVVVDAPLLERADLVVGMERAHVREAVVLEPTVWHRTFTLRELVRRAEAAEPRGADQSLRAWLEALSAGRQRMELMGSSPDDDIADPTTDWTIDHATTAALLDDLVRRLVKCAWPV